MALREEIERARALRRSGVEGCASAATHAVATIQICVASLRACSISAQSSLAISPFHPASNRPSTSTYGCSSVTRCSCPAARALSTILDDIHVDRLAAIPYAGLPMGSALFASNQDADDLSRRKGGKSFISGRAIEGHYQPGETVVVLDDLITTGQQAGRDPALARSRTARPRRAGADRP